MPPYFDIEELQRTFASLETEELEERIRLGLEPKAEELACKILAERRSGEVVSNGLGTTTPAISKLPSDIRAEVLFKLPSDIRAEQETLARQLWRGPLVWVCKISFCMFVAPMIRFMSNSQPRPYTWGEAAWRASFWGVLTIVLGYFFFRVGTSITRRIVASEVTMYQKKVKQLWLLLAGVFIANFFIVNFFA